MGSNPNRESANPSLPLEAPWQAPALQPPLVKVGITSRLKRMGRSSVAFSTFTGTVRVRPPNSIFSSVSPSATGLMMLSSNFTKAGLANVYLASLDTSRVVLSANLACSMICCLPRNVTRWASFGYTCRSTKSFGAALNRSGEASRARNIFFMVLIPKFILALSNVYLAGSGITPRLPSAGFLITGAAGGAFTRKVPRPPKICVTWCPL